MVTGAGDRICTRPWVQLVVLGTNGIFRHSSLHWNIGRTDCGT
jgi:hypothetical protein